MPGPRRSHPSRRGFAVAVVLDAFFVLAAVTAAPALALYAELWNTLDGPVIGGVVPAGASHINQCRNPGSSFDLVVDVQNVNLADATPLTLTYGGVIKPDGTPANDAKIGTFRLTGGAGHFEATVAGQAGANDNIYVKRGTTIVLSATDRWDTQSVCS